MRAVNEANKGKKSLQTKAIKLYWEVYLAGMLAIVTVSNSRFELEFSGSRLHYMIVHLHDCQKFQF